MLREKKFSFSTLKVKINSKNLKNGFSKGYPKI